MKIARKYEWFGVLYNNDPKSRELIDGILDKWHRSNKCELLECDYAIAPADMGMGCGLAGEAYQALRKGLDELDVSNPYDNGLTLANVTRIEYEAYDNGTMMEMKMFWNCTTHYEMGNKAERVVAIATVTNSGGMLVMESALV